MSDIAFPISAASIRGMARGDMHEKAVDWRFHLRRVFERVTGFVFNPFRRLVLWFAARRVRAVARRFERYKTSQVIELLAERRGSVVSKRPLCRANLKTCALLVEVSRRELGLTPFVTQIMGALAIFSGKLAEMDTGSGKTLTVALAATMAAFGGERVHVVTANDYLARRDQEAFARFFETLGITSGLIVADVAQVDRRTQYANDIVYACNKEIAFDYLRNRISLGADAGPIRLAIEPVFSANAKANSMTMTNLPFAIVDEADSVLIDECRTPLIISSIAKPDPDWAHQALALGDALTVDADYKLNKEERRISLTPSGKKKLAAQAEELGGIWLNATRREHAATQAISARAFYVRDEHYIVVEGKVELIDEYTGRVAEGRALGDGLHQIIEAKEGCEISGRRYTQGRMTYQRFFRRYRRLAGTTGTAREVSGELFAVYGQHVLRIPPPMRCRRRTLWTRIFSTEEKKWGRVVARIRTMTGRGRPVLVATRTVRASAELSEKLNAAGIEHQLLNAVQDADEAGIIARAGEAGRVTVATNMAGRGVDIQLTQQVRDLGGLHVILTEMHEAGRIDRQVMGRSGRQGDPGSYEEYLSWTDALVEKFGGWRRRLRYGGRSAFLFAQKRAERLHSRARIDLLRGDMRREEQLGFTGSTE